MEVVFFCGTRGSKEPHQGSNWKNLKRFAPKKSKNDLVDASGAHFKVGNASRSGGRVADKAINEHGESQVALGSKISMFRSQSDQNISSFWGRGLKVLLIETD